MKIIVFDMEGKFAHFRKYYTNSSSLTYSAPPRTTIEGLIGAILGYERDSYYEKLNQDNLKIGVRIISNNRRIMQSINYLKVTSQGQLIDPKEHTQIPFEILTSDNNVRFRIYVALRDTKVLNELEQRLKNRVYVYPPYMGAAPFSCRLNYIDTIEGEKIESKETLEISSLLKVKNICHKGIEIDFETVSLIKERMPVDFLKDRYARDVGSYIFCPRGGKIRAKLNSEAYELKYLYKDEKIDENIVFM
ncbi:type I-B CRISPR-associated protein Cas5b [Hathewaya histolytica]|uniref:type I-B CRISPR-associated protein Cas5b n=1 Tax=Hathewaya histolytica TaxID=1498 RepID=UPI003B685F31